MAITQTFKTVWVELMLKQTTKKAFKMESCLLKAGVELHGFEQVGLFGLQYSSHLLTHGPELRAFGQDGVHGIVGVLDQRVPFSCQSQGPVQHLLHSQREGEGEEEREVLQLNSDDLHLLYSKFQKLFFCTTQNSD